MISFADASRLVGTVFSGKSVEIDLGFGELEGLVRLGDPEMTRPRKVISGSRRDRPPIGLTAGRYSPPKLELGFLVATGQFVLEKLSQAGDGSIAEAVLDAISVSAHEPDNAVLITVTFQTCVCIGVKWDQWDEDSNESYLVTSFQTMSVDQNGLVMHSP
jgi:hypothetical protein